MTRPPDTPAPDEAGSNAAESPVEPYVAPAVPDEPSLELPPLTSPWMAPLLHTYARTLNMAQACRIVGVTTAAVKKAKQRHPEFREACKQAEEIGVELLAQIAHRRATTGEQVRETRRTVKRDMGGNVVEDVTVEVERVEVDNSMLRWLLARKAPALYGDRQDLRITGDPASPVRIEVYRTPTHERALELLRIAAEESIVEGTATRELPPGEAA